MSVGPGVIKGFLELSDPGRMDSSGVHGQNVRFGPKADVADDYSIMIWAISLSPSEGPQAARRRWSPFFGLVVDNKEAARNALEAAGVTLLDGPFPDFRDPWGNRVEIVGYDNIQFTKAPNVLRGMGLMHLAKNQKAKKELAEKGMALE